MGNPLVLGVLFAITTQKNANPDTNHNANPTNPNGNCKWYDYLPHRTTLDYIGPHRITSDQI